MTPAERAAEVEDRWERRPRLALLVRMVVFLAPAVAATDVTLVLTRFLPEPRGVPGSVVWWVAVLASSAVTLVAFDRLFRRLLPLSVLLDLSLVFPGVAPSRFTASFRAGTVKNLHRRIEQAKADAGDAGTAEAAATVVELIAALAVHDPRTRGHSERTRAYSDLVAEEVGLGAADRDRLRWSALLHDIGKLHVTASVLNKPGRPDPDEWMVLRNHPVEGARITGALRDWLGPWGLAIEQHHEHFDGTGYPHGLAGEEISLGGRIVSVADAYEVMTAVRAYSSPVTPAAAREELVRCAGTHFDPEIVRAFLRIGIGRFPRRAGILVALAQLPWFVRVGQLLQPAGSAVAAGTAVVALAAGGVVVPGSAGLGGAAPGSLGEQASPTTMAPQAPGTGTEPAPTVLGGGDPVLPGDSSPPTSSTAPSGTATSSTSTSPTGPATTAVAAGSTTSSPAPGVYYLGGTAPDESATPAELRPARPAGTGAPDYDGDGMPGRTLAPSSRPVTTTDPAEHQLWVAHLPAAATIEGTPKLTISSAVAASVAGKGILRGILLDCDAGGASCLKRPISTAILTDTTWSDGSGGFAEKTLTFSRSNHVIAAGRALVLRLAAQNGSSPLLLAYGSESHPAFLEIDIR